MYLTFIKLLVSLSLLVCCGFVGRVLYSRVVQGKDPRHRCTVRSCYYTKYYLSLLSVKLPKIVFTHWIHFRV